MKELSEIYQYFFLFFRHSAELSLDWGNVNLIHEINSHLSNNKMNFVAIFNFLIMVHFDWTKQHFYTL